MALADLVVDGLDLREERIGVVGKRVLRAPEGELPAGSQHPMGFPVRSGRIDPVPRRRGIDELVRLVLAIPVLERDDVDVEWATGQGDARLLGEVRPQLHSDNGESAIEERSCRLAGRAADLEQAGARFELAQRYQVIEELVRIGGARSVMETRR
jgi:hypothetical protein